MVSGLAAAPAAALSASSRASRASSSAIVFLVSMLLVGELRLLFFSFATSLAAQGGSLASRAGSKSEKEREEEEGWWSKESFVSDGCVRQTSGREKVRKKISRLEIKTCFSLPAAPPGSPARSQPHKKPKGAAATGAVDLGRRRSPHRCLAPRAFERPRRRSRSRCSSPRRSLLLALFFFPSFPSTI